MATYRKISTNKTVNVTSAAGEITIIYYAGNEDAAENFIGNADKRPYLVSSSISWITNVTFGTKDATAKTITLRYSENTSTSDRSCNLKLSGAKDPYIILFILEGKTESVNPSDPAVITIIVDAAKDNIESQLCLVTGVEINENDLNNENMPNSGMNGPGIIQINEHTFELHGYRGGLTIYVDNLSDNTTILTPGLTCHIYVKTGELGQANTRWKYAGNYQFNGGATETWYVNTDS